MNSFSQFRTAFRSKSVSIALLACTVLAGGCASPSGKRPSPLRRDTVKIGSLDAYITFSSPAVKERKIFGSGDEFLVPFNQVWRTGANNATNFYISDKAFIDSIALDSGRYSIFTIPNKELWTVIINKDWDQWGSYDYSESLDVGRIEVVARQANQVQERMLFYFADDSLKFRWDKVRWAVRFTDRP